MIKPYVKHCVLAALAGLFLAASLPAAVPAAEQEDFRGVWIATVGNTNWPKKGADADEQKQAFVNLLDEAVSMRLNAVIVQIRPTADAFYQSELNPWSEYLTGTQGQDPGFDPLAFMIDEAHKRGLEFHAWFNPFRVSTNASSDKAWAPTSVMVTHPDWTVRYGSQIWLDPGLPRVRAYVVDSVMEVVNNYDIDAVHFDDYFYPYPENGESFPDDWSYAAYGDGYANIADWRRHNIDDFIHTMYLNIKATKDYVKFGVSPMGIWRSQNVDPAGADTPATGSYDLLYADSRKWMEEDWLDYIAPQLYWTIEYPRASYDKLLDFWVKEARKCPRVHLYIGQAAYQVGGSGAWSDPTEILRQMSLGRDTGEVKGYIFYNIGSLIKNPLSLRDNLLNTFYQADAKVPAMPWLEYPQQMNYEN
jgi:uncharacterized lipoprotein YddW (UPF0748 family)